MRRGFENLGLSAIWCAYYEGNTKSARTQEKIGFEPIRVTQNVPVPLLGETRTEHVNRMTREQWETLIA